MKTGEKIAVLRHKKGYSVTDIAMKLNISSYTVMDWEENKPIAEEYLYPLCKLLDISVSDFLDESYVVSDDLVNHNEEHIHEDPLPKRHKKERNKEETFYKASGSKNVTSNDAIYFKYKKMTLWIRIGSFLIIALFAFLFFFFILNHFPPVFFFVFIFFGVFFFVDVMILVSSTYVKKYSYKGHSIIRFQAFIYNRLYIDGEATRLVPEPGPYKMRYAPGIINIDGEKLYFVFRDLRDEKGNIIPPEK